MILNHGASLNCYSCNNGFRAGSVAATQRFRISSGPRAGNLPVSGKFRPVRWP